MSNQKTVVSDAVSTAFALSSEQIETLAVSAEMAMDAAYDFRKSCENTAGVFKSIKDANALTFAAWEVVRKYWESRAEIRARDNHALDPAGAANDRWQDVAKHLREFYGLQKPRSDNADSAAKAAKREADKASALEAAGGKSAVELKSEVMALYGQASDESIAQAKALEKALKLVKSAEADAVKSQMKPLVESATAKHKQILELLKSDPKRMGDYVVLLAKTYDIWVEQLKS